MEASELGKWKAGRIEISREMLFNKEYRWAIQMLFSKFIPYKILPSDWPPKVEYIGLCDDFKEITEGDPIPKYHVEFMTESRTMAIREIVE